MKNRNVGIDLLRIIFSFFVVCIHCRPVFILQQHSNVNALLLPILYACNSGFFILSGYFSLDNVDYIKKWYFKKIRNLLIPWGIYSLIVYIWEIWYNKQSFAFFFRNFIVAFISGNIAEHFWFMYALAGMMLSAPFISKLFSLLSKNQIKGLFCIAIFFLQFQIVLGYYGINFAFSFIINGWMVVFCSGFYIRKILSKNNLLLIFGVLGYIISVILVRFFPTFEHSYDWSIVYIIFCCAIVIVFSKLIKVKSEKASLALSILSKYTFSIYMIHFVVTSYIPYYYFPHLNVWGQYIVVSILVYLTSFVAALVIDNTIVKIVKNIYDKILGKLLIKL